ncbi:MAG: hypothetical protein CMH27_11045 [Micavibrio sp.]|nr:hypothetical protein [Micavibrio sp.]|tara:strand:- start:2181 stop:3176 length:996 start_codon:yes stop_codon:yes gene_type:complete
MSEFHSSLLREKFSIHDSEQGTDEQKMIIALSNRLVIELKGAKKNHTEIFVVRAQNMHSCVRMAARIIKSYKTSGPLTNRTKPFDWEAAWDAIVNDYEYRYNPERWIAIYHNGHTVFEAGEHHLLLDVIEKCDARNAHNYEKALPMAEDAFKKAGKVVKIDYDSNVALVINLEQSHGRFGVIMRGPSRTTTFNFSVHAKTKDPINFAQCLAAAACFLEGIQLAFMVGMNNIKLYMGIIKRHSTEEKQTKDAGRRLGRLAAEIANLERSYDVHYRPEKPEFHKIVSDAERLGQKTLSPPEEDQEEEDHEDDNPADKLNNDGDGNNANNADAN